MSPIFKNYSDSANQLSKLIADEQIVNPVFTYINPDAKNYCQLVCPESSYFFDLHPSLPATIVILDDSSTRATEFIEFTDQIKQKYPAAQITIAVPVVPQSEEATFKANCDRLLTLHTEPLFFSINQFYQQNSS